VETIRETLHKELIDVRRQFADASFEKEKYSSSNKELREHVKRVESQKREQSRALEEAQQKISGD
jgi:rootletin